MSKANYKSAIALFLSLFFLSVAAQAEINSKEIIELSKGAEPHAWQYVNDHGAKVVPTRDGRSFVVTWLPAGFDVHKGIVFVSLHGHANWATKNFEVWHEHLAKKGFAYVGIQWWYGRSMEPIGYAPPREIYTWIRETLESLGVPPGHVVFEGFSMGAANSYAVTFIDRRQSAPYFAVTISNAGHMEADFPPNRGFLDKRDGPKPFQGAHWILYCGELNAGGKGDCKHMQETKEKLEELGAVVDRFIRDPKGDHGGFMKNGNADSALDLAGTIVKEK